MSAKTIAFTIIIAICLAGCAGAPAAVQETPAQQAATTSPPPTAPPAPTDTATATADMAATQVAQSTADAQATKDVRTTRHAATRTQLQSERLATETLQKEKALKTAQVKQATSTAQIAGFYQVIEKLQAEGVLGDTKGELYQLDDYTRSEAQINYLFWEPTEYDATNFVFAAKMDWSSASMIANWDASGCGLVFGLKSHSQYNFSYLGLDGFVYSSRLTNDVWKPLAYKRWGKPDLPDGQAHFMMTVWEKHIQIYINDALVSSMQDGGYTPGDIALSVVSGTNKDWGTRCNFSDVMLYIFE
jgi:hypothetical protein